MKRVTWLLSLFMLLTTIGCGDPEPVDTPEDGDPAAEELDPAEADAESGLDDPGAADPDDPA